MLQNLKHMEAILLSHLKNKLGHVHQNNAANHHYFGGKRSTTTSGNPHKRHPKSVNSREFKPPSIRKPYSPASATGSSKINPKNSQEHENGARKVTPKEAQATKTLLASTPSKSRSTGNDEIVTPKTVPTLVQTTPTISVPMQTAATPDIPYAPSAVRAVEVDFEYSLEEMRAVLSCQKVK